MFPDIEEMGMVRSVVAVVLPTKVAACPVRRSKQGQAKLYIKALLLTLRFTMKNSSNRLVRSIGEQWSAIAATTRGCPTRSEAPG